MSVAEALTRPDVRVSLGAVTDLTSVGLVALRARYGGAPRYGELVTPQLTKLLPPERAQWWRAYTDDPSFLDQVHPDPQATEALGGLMGRGYWVTIEADRPRPRTDFERWLRTTGIPHSDLDATGPTRLVADVRISDDPLEAAMSLRGGILAPRPWGPAPNTRGLTDWRELERYLP